jgi:hypothetical protein
MEAREATAASRIQALCRGHQQRQRQRSGGGSGSDSGSRRGMPELESAAAESVVPLPAEMSSDDDDVETDAAILMAFYAQVEPAFATHEKVARVIAHFRARARSGHATGGIGGGGARGGGEAWREDMYAAIAQQRGSDPREVVSSSSHRAHGPPPPLSEGSSSVVVDAGMAAAASCSSSSQPPPPPPPPPAAGRLLSDVVRAPLAVASWPPPRWPWPLTLHSVGLALARRRLCWCLVLRHGGGGGGGGRRKQPPSWRLAVPGARLRSPTARLPAAAAAAAGARAPRGGRGWCQHSEGREWEPIVCGVANALTASFIGRAAEAAHCHYEAQLSSLAALRHDVVKVGEAQCGRARATRPEYLGDTGARELCIVG